MDKKKDRYEIRTCSFLMCAITARMIESLKRILMKVTIATSRKRSQRFTERGYI